jgi:peroxiredoxin Q/BCP
MNFMTAAAASAILAPARHRQGFPMTIAIGQPAPDFTLPTENGPMSLADFRSRKLVLYFYPKDDTSGCTSQAKAFRDDYQKFLDAGAAILGVSRDPLASHARFRAKHSLPFALGADEDGTVCEAYGVWKQKSMYGRTYMGIERTTVLIDENGVVVQIWPKVKVTGHSAAVLAALGAA